MAYIVPADLTTLALAGVREPELTTLAVLKARLSPDYTVFHGVHWTRAYKGDTVFGEIDFVVINPAGDVLVIEQKNGRLQETVAGLGKEYDGRSKNVSDQVRRSLENVRSKFQWQHPGGRQLNLDYLIYCPDYQVQALNAVGLDRSRIVDSTEADGLPERIADVLGPGAKGDPTWVEQVQAFFRQTFELVPDIHAHILAQERNFTRLSGGLADLVAHFEMSPLRLRIRGTAGCGKSLAAHRLYQSALQRGKQPLLVCFTRPLRERLNALLGRAGGGGRVETFYGLCDAFLRGLGQRQRFEDAKSDPQFWQSLAEKVLLEFVPDSWKFDLLVIDEGQDFEEHWFEIARCFLRPDADIVWLEDPDQNVFDRSAASLDGFVGYRARANYRSPDLIARFIRKSLPFEFEPANDLPGQGVGITSFDDPQEQPAKVATIVDALLREGFRYEDIVVLACCGHQRSAFSNRQRAGRHTLKHFTQEYDMFGNQLMTEGRLLFESVYRFKGQQSPAVILVDVDPNADRVHRELMVLFCGMTRATVRLEMLIRDGNPENDRFRAR